MSEDIRRAALEAGARNVRVFGSAARGDDRDGSDLDVLIDFPVRERGLLPLADLADQISELLDVPAPRSPRPAGTGVDAVPRRAPGGFIGDHARRSA